MTNLKKLETEFDILRVEFLETINNENYTEETPRIKYLMEEMERIDIAIGVEIFGN